MKTTPKNVNDIVAEFDERFEVWKAKEGKHVLENFPENHNNLARDVKNFLRTQISSLLEAKIEEMEGEKMPITGYDTIDHINNAAITRAQSILKEALK